MSVSHCNMLTQSAYMRFLAMYVYLVDDLHLDHLSTDIPRRDNHMNTRCRMDTRSRTCA